MVSMPNLKKMDGKKLKIEEINIVLLSQMGFLNELKNKNICFNLNPFKKSKCTIKDVQNGQTNLVDFHIEFTKKIDKMIDKNEKESRDFQSIPKERLDFNLQDIVEIRSPWNKDVKTFEFNPEIKNECEWTEANEENNEINKLFVGEKEDKTVSGLGRIKVRKQEKTETSKNKKAIKTNNGNGFKKSKKELEETKEELERRKKELEEMERLAKEKEEELKHKAEEKKKQKKLKEIEKKKRQKEAQRKEKERRKLEKKAEKERKKLEREKEIQLKKEEKLKKIEAEKLLKQQKEEEALTKKKKLEMEKKRKQEAKRLLKEKQLKEAIEEKERKEKEKEQKKKEKKSIVTTKEKPEEEKIQKQEKEEFDNEWDEEVRQAFTIIDDLLENLPDEKIDEFVNSEDFQIYERVVSRYKKKRE